jgi:hypothetical protein
MILDSFFGMSRQNRRHTFWLAIPFPIGFNIRVPSFRSPVPELPAETVHPSVPHDAIEPDFP